MQHVTVGRLVALTTMLVAPAACGGGGDERPSAAAIEASMKSSTLVADLSADEVSCFARALHDGELASATLVKLVGTGATQSDIDQFNRVAPDAARACGFAYISG